MTDKKTIAVIGGTGHEGPGLAARWAKSGQYRVIIGSRKQEKAQQVAAEWNEKLGAELLTGMQNEDAVRACDIAVLTVPYKFHNDTLAGLKELLQGKILVDVTVPLKPPKVSIAHIPPEGAAGQQAQTLLGDGVRVVSAFQNIGAGHLSDVNHAIDCDVLVCGNDAGAKETVIAMAQAAGMRGIDAGPIQNAAIIEGLTAVLIGINIRHKAKAAGIKITGI